MLPLLRQCDVKGTIDNAQIRKRLAGEFQLTPEEEAQLLPSGKQAVFRNRVAWAQVYLVKAGLLERPKRGVLRITQAGRDVLNTNPNKINIKFLKKFPSFVAFRTKQDNENIANSETETSSDRTPSEQIEEGFQTLKNEILDDILVNIKSCSPQFFERLVIKLLLAMGYGGSVKDAGMAIGKSGDEGIDGLIKEDKLGLDVIYVQAKKWDTNTIGRPEIQKFAGALLGKQASKGVFITTSYFTKEAEAYAEDVNSRIILIDGQRLADLMFEYNIGVNTADYYEIKKIDSDFFSED